MALLTIMLYGFVGFGLLILGLVVLPIAYIYLCRQMRAEKVKDAPYYPFFFEFGTLGGICVLPLLLLSPSRPFYFGLVLLASVMSLVTAILLAFQPERNRYQERAMWWGFVAAIPVYILVGAWLRNVL